MLSNQPNVVYLANLGACASSALTASNHAFESHPPDQPNDEADDGAENGTDDAMTPPQQRARNCAEQQARTAKDQHDDDLTDRIVEDADV
jgi:hypothetical protein